MQCTVTGIGARGLKLAQALAALLVVLAAFLLACSDDDGTVPSTSTAPTRATATLAPGVADRVALGGLLTVDGVPLEAEFLGARVIKQGLPAACQVEIPSVAEGVYQLGVLAETEARGCGTSGAQVVLWTFVDDKFLFSEQALDWPGGETANFDASFSSASPLGITTPVTEFKGQLFGRSGEDLPPGTLVEAFAGDTRCGITSLRPRIGDDQLYTLIVAGPGGVAGCEVGAVLSFLLDGEPAIESAVNDLASGGNGHDLNLTLR